MNRTTRNRAALVLAAALAVATVTATAARGAANAKPPVYKSGGTLYVGLSEGEPDVLDPTLARTFSGREVFLTFCEKLYDLDAKTNIVPQLASALPTTSTNGLTVTIPLRQGIKFNDGTPFNAAAVVKSLNRDITLKGSVRASELAPVASVNASGPYKVVIHLKTPYSPLLAQLTDRAGMIMSPKQLAKLGANFAQNPICVGPFMYQNRVAGDSITVVKSPYYYDKQNVHLNRIVFKVENDTAAAAAALKAGDLQALDYVDPTQLPGLLADSSLRVKSVAGLGYQGVTINVGNKNGTLKPYSPVSTDLAQSAKLREAFEMAIDRNAMNKVVFGGTVLPGCTAISPSSAWFDKSVKCTPYDPTMAKQLVAQSGIKNPTVTLMVPTATVGLRLAQFLQSEEQAVGIKVNIDSIDFVTSLSNGGAGKFDAYQIGWSGRVDPDGNIYGFVATPGTLNYAGYSNPQVDKLLNDARTQSDMTKRKADYKQVEQILLNDRPIVYLYHAVGRAASSKQVAGIKMYPDTLIRVAFAGYTK